MIETKELQIIHITKIDSEGRNDTSLPLDQALEYIKKELTSNGMWLYVDGRPTTVEGLNIPELVNATEICIMPQLIGG